MIAARKQGTTDATSPARGRVFVSRAPLAALLCALAVGGLVLAGEAGATPRMGGEAQAAEVLESLVLPKTAIATAMRRTAMADPDLDSVVSSLEAAKYYEARFRLLDENRDGSVDGPEFLRAAAVRSLHALDGFSKPRPLAFESVDVDGNGMLTPEEFLRADVLRRSLAAAGGVDARRQATFEAVDTDDDGALSRQEFMDAGTQDFNGSDADGDGKVTIWEFYGATRL
jgi:Ca2+-binding EF-hand superfamily protein